MSERRTLRVVFGASAVALLVFCLLPFVYMLAVSMAGDPADVTRGELSRSAIHYIEVFTTPGLHFGRYLINSIFVAAVSSCICIALASLAAYGVTRMPSRRKTTILMVVVCFAMFPQISQVGFLYDVASRLGWINTYRGLVLPYVAWILPLSFWFLVSYFSKIPLELDHAALIDGCSRLGILFRIILPVAVPGLVSTLLLGFIFGYNEFLFALLLTTDESTRTLPVGIAFFEGLHGEIPWGTVMAASGVATAPVVLLAVIFQRRIVEGLTRGAVKG